MTKNITISIPDDLKAEMDKYSEVNWSQVVLKAIKDYIAKRQIPKKKSSFMGELFSKEDEEDL